MRVEGCVKGGWREGWNGWIKGFVGSYGWVLKCRGGKVD